MKLLYVIFALYFAGTVPVKSDIRYKKLTWSDFKVKSVIDNTASETVTGIGYSYDSELGVTVHFSFDNSESFVVPSAKTDYILNHEQGHFDITYIYAQKFARLLSQQGTLSEKAIDEIYNQIVTEKDIMQGRYDSQTKHSEERAVQAKWDTYINNLLQLNNCK